MTSICGEIQVSNEGRRLVAAVGRDLTEGGLHPSRHLLIVVPGLDGQPYGLQKAVFQALREAGVSVYLPGNRDADVPKQRWPDTDPNGFWREGSVTVSPVMQAKGNEADVVYFVGVSRSRGWVHLSGAGMAQTRLADEIQRVIAADGTLKFVYRPPKRQLDDVG